MSKEKDKIEEENKKASQEKPKDETPKAEEKETSLKEAIEQQAIEDEAPLTSRITLRKILGGDILTAQAIRHQIWLILLIMFFVLIYISNRYSVQKDIIEIAKLQKELQDAKYRALSSSSKVTEISRESNVLNELKNNQDSDLQIAKQPPYIINVPEGEEDQEEE